MVSPVGQAREDWMIIRALSEEVGQTLPYDSVEEIRYRMAELAPHLLKYDYIEPSLFGELALATSLTKNKMHPTPFTDNIDVTIKLIKELLHDR